MIFICSKGVLSMTNLDVVLFVGQHNFWWCQSNVNSSLRLFLHLMKNLASKSKSVHLMNLTIIYLNNIRPIFEDKFEFISIVLRMCTYSNISDLNNSHYNHRSHDERLPWSILWIDIEQFCHCLRPFSCRVKYLVRKERHLVCRF